jgi:hypothetical protein
MRGVAVEFYGIRVMLRRGVERVMTNRGRGLPDTLE